MNLTTAFEGIDTRLDSIENLLNRWLEESRIKDSVPKKNATKYCTIKEACKEFKVSIPTIYDRINKGLITKHKFGGRTLLERSEIESVLIPMESRRA
jgi:excisionase family DNA binding protein